MKSEYAMILVMGVLVSLFCAVAIFKFWREDQKKRAQSREEKSAEFDERQELARGRAASNGFSTLLIYNFVLCVICLGGSPKWCEPYAMQMLGITLALGVFSVYCIWNEAYVGLKSNFKSVCFLFGVLGGLNLLQGIADAANGRMFVDGVMTNRLVSLAYGILLTVDFVVLLLRERLNRRKAEEER